MRKCPVSCPMYDASRKMCMQCGRYIKYLDRCAASALTAKYDREDVDDGKRDKLNC